MKKEYLVGEIIYEINNGKTIKQVASDFVIDESEIRRLLFSYGGELGKKLLIDELEGVLPIREIVQKYIEYRQQNCIPKLYEEYPYRKR